MYRTETHAVPRPGGDLPIHRWIPENPRAGVVVVQEIFGVSSYVKDRAADLAAAGYVVDVPELYFRLPAPVVSEDDPELLTKGMDLMASTPWEQAVADLRAAANNLKEDLPALASSAKLAYVGFCYGGGVAYAAAAEAEGDSPVDALVSYYGSALPALLHLTVTAPSLHHFGTADQFIPLDQVEKIQEHVEAAGAQFHLYDGAGHAFDNTLPAFHHPQAAAAAWPVTLDFLDRTL